MRILEFTPPSFLPKARLVCQSFKGFVDQFTSIYVNQRKENFGFDMPPPPPHLTDQQYNELLGGKKGCVAEGCHDRRAIRTHWSWYKRWCWECWKERIEREDRAVKSRGVTYGRATLTKMLECIPVGMHDSFMKPHDYMEHNETTRARGAPRLYKYYLTEDINRIIKEFESLNPEPYVENPNHTATERAAALAAHQELMDGLEAKRVAFFAERKAQNDEHMALVQRIEAGIRNRRARNRDPYDSNRNARKELFTRRAGEDIPHIPIDFVQGTVAYKAATRIFRDGGTERGWLTLKPKIVAEWEEAQAKKEAEAALRMETAVSEAGVRMDVAVAEANRALGAEEPATSNLGAHNGLTTYDRLQSYNSELLGLEKNRMLHRSYATSRDKLPGLAATYHQTLSSSQPLFLSPGDAPPFTGLSYGSAPIPEGMGGGPLARSQSAPSGHHLVPAQPSGIAGLSADLIPEPPSKQITVNSLLGPPGPAWSNINRR